MRSRLKSLPALSVLATALCIGLNANALPSKSWVRSPNGALLLYAPPESDDSDLDIICEAGKPYFTLTVQAGPNDQKFIRLSSGALSRTYPATTRRDDLYDIASAKADKSDAVLKAFQKTGALRVDGRKIDAKTDAERRAVSAFFGGCR